MWIGRYVLLGLTALSALLLVGSAVLWVRSYHAFGQSLYVVTHNGLTRPDFFALHATGLASTRGQIGWFRIRLEADVPAPWGSSFSEVRDSGNRSSRG
jgi:hypothetical protein